MRIDRVREYGGKINCIDQHQTQSRQFRFAVNRLILLTSAHLFDLHDAIADDLKLILIDSLEDHAASTDQYCRLLGLLNLSPDDLEKISHYLGDNEKSIHSWQNYHLWLLLAKKKHKTNALIALAVSRIETNVLLPEVSAIFIYLFCVDESRLLEPLVTQFKSTWPYYHQRYFLLATNEFDREVLKPLINELGTKLRGTVQRARSHLKDGLLLNEVEPVQALDLYNEISPYD